MSRLGRPAVAVEDRTHRRLLLEGSAKVCSGSVAETFAEVINGGDTAHTLRLLAHFLDSL